MVKILFKTVETVFDVTTDFYKQQGTIKTRSVNLLDTDRALNLHMRFGRPIEHLMYVLRTYDLHHKFRHKFRRKLINSGVINLFMNYEL